MLNLKGIKDFHHSFRGQNPLYARQFQTIFYSYSALRLSAYDTVVYIFSLNVMDY